MQRLPNVFLYIATFVRFEHLMYIKCLQNCRSNPCIRNASFTTQNMPRSSLVVTCIDTVSAWPCFVAVCTDSPKLQDVIVLSLLCHHQQCLLFCICTLVQSSHEIVLSSGCISHVHWCVVAVVSDLAWIPECIVLFPGGHHKHWKHRDFNFHSCSEGTCSTCQEDEGTGDSIQCVCVCS